MKRIDTKNPSATILKYIFLVVFLFPMLIINTNAQTTYRAVLSGSHEVPPVTTTATGDVTATLDGNMLTVEGTFSNLSSPVATDIAGGAHIHMEWPGRNGGVIFPLDIDLEENNTAGSISGDNNQFELNEDQLEALENRRLYVNIHTMNYMPGEIRGHLLPDADEYFRSNLSGPGENPPVLTRAHGSVTAELDGNILTVAGSFQDLGSNLTQAHIHMEITGRNAGVVFPLVIEEGEDNRSGTFAASDNSFELNQDQLDALAARRLYINVHSQDNPPGEIRGQIVPQVTMTMVARMSGSAEEADVISDATGAVLVELDGTTLTLTGSFSDLGSDYSNSHIHLAPAGRSGGVTIPLQATVDPGNMREGIFEAENNTYEVNEDQIAQLMSRDLYINVHSQDHPPGEIRGQLLGESRAFFTATFSGLNEVPPLFSDGTGGVEIEYKGNRIVMTGSFAGLTSNYTASHFHLGGPHESGGVVIDVHPAIDENETGGLFLIDDNRYQMQIDEDFIDNLFAENLYINIHSSTFPPGELRGQVLRAPNFYPGETMTELPEEGSTIVIGGDAGQQFEVAWSLADDPDGNAVVYIWQVATDEDFSSIVAMENTGSDHEIMITYQQADEFLEEQNVGTGESIMLWHRVIVSDGSLHRTSDAGSFTLERGTLTSLEPGDGELPLVTRLNQNYPNPFNPSTGISFTLAESGQVELTVYNITGQRVAVLMQDQLSPGEYSVRFDAGSLASGIYVYRLKTAGNVMTRKMVLVK